MTKSFCPRGRRTGEKYILRLVLLLIWTAPMFILHYIAEAHKAELIHYIYFPQPFIPLFQHIYKTRILGTYGALCTPCWCKELASNLSHYFNSHVSLSMYIRSYFVCTSQKINFTQLTRVTNKCCCICFSK